jgi:hypothetical protein
LVFDNLIFVQVKFLPQDWCLGEGERLQSAYLIILDKLMGYCESHQEYEAGMAYGQRIMRYERARESTRVLIAIPLRGS